MDQLPGRSDNSIKNRWHIISRDGYADHLNGKLYGVAADSSDPKLPLKTEHLKISAAQLPQIRRDRAASIASSVDALTEGEAESVAQLAPVLNEADETFFGLLSDWRGIEEIDEKVLEAESEVFSVPERNTTFDFKFGSSFTMQVHKLYPGDGPSLDFDSNSVTASNSFISSPPALAVAGAAANTCTAGPSSGHAATAAGDQQQPVQGLDRQSSAESTTSSNGSSTKSSRGSSARERLLQLKIQTNSLYDMEAEYMLESSMAGSSAGVPGATFGNPNSCSTSSEHSQSTPSSGNFSGTGNNNQYSREDDFNCPAEGSEEVGVSGPGGTSCITGTDEVEEAVVSCWDFDPSKDLPSPYIREALGFVGSALNSPADSQLNMLLVPPTSAAASASASGSASSGSGSVPVPVAAQQLAGALAAQIADALAASAAATTSGSDNSTMASSTTSAPATSKTYRTGEFSPALSSGGGGGVSANANVSSGGSGGRGRGSRSERPLSGNQASLSSLLLGTMAPAPAPSMAAAGAPAGAPAAGFGGSIGVAAGAGPLTATNVPAAQGQGQSQGQSQGGAYNSNGYASHLVNGGLSLQHSPMVHSHLSPSCPNSKRTKATNNGQFSW
jgi:hypothetical protein